MIAAPFIPAPDLQLQDLGWGALSGLGTGMGMVLLYRGLSNGSMSVVVPLVAVARTAIPVLIGVTLLGDRPSVLSWLGIALQYIALAQAGDGAGLWPIVAGRFAASLAILPLAGAAFAGMRRIRLPIVLLAVVTGGIAALALTLYMLAAQMQLVTIAVVRSSLYPVIPVLLGITVLSEKLSAQQAAGLLAAGAAVCLISVG